MKKFYVVRQYDGPYINMMGGTFVERGFKNKADADEFARNLNPLTGKITRMVTEFNEVKEYERFYGHIVKGRKLIPDGYVACYACDDRWYMLDVFGYPHKKQEKKDGGGPVTD